MAYKQLTAGHLGANLGILPESQDDVATEQTGALTGTTPAIVAGAWTWTLSGASTPTSSLVNGQSCTLLITAGAYSITWPTSTVVGTWPTGLDAGVNVIVLFKVGGVLYRSYSGVAV